MAEKKVELKQLSVADLVALVGLDLETFSLPQPRVNYYSDGLTVTFDNRQIFQVNIKEITIKE